MMVKFAIVCWSLLFLSSSHAAGVGRGTLCESPEGSGHCIRLQQCHYFSNMLTSMIVNNTYIMKFNCADNDNVVLSKVCCPDGVNTTSRLSSNIFGPNLPCANSIQPYPQGSQCCGVNMDLDQKGPDVYSIADLDQYPWLALIEYKNGNKIKLLCTGALISSKYVVTAGHCVLGPVINAGKPTNVRLGDYDVSNDGSDVITVEGGGTHTNNPIVIAIESILVHEDFIPVDNLRRHDIALLRLQSTVAFTEFIQPICLPTADVSDGTNLISAGWGALNDLHFGSDVIKHTVMPFVNRESCQNYYRTKLWSGQICAGGAPGKDSCVGDSGGPLVHQDRSTGRFELYGVHSFGSRPCSIEEVPLVYTKVLEYNSWIRFHTEKSCVTSRGERGQCMEERQCQGRTRTYNHHAAFSNQTTCKSTGSVPMICCPDICPTAEESGRCSSIYTCPHMTHTGLTKRNASRCFGPEPYRICCSSVATSTNTSEFSPMLPTAPSCTLTEELPDPKLGCCGRTAESASIDLVNRISGGKTASIYSTPWLVYLEYNPRDEVICGGSLITGKHVLTAAHCVSTAEMKSKNITVTHVRLGDFDIINDGPDCVTSPSGANNTCTDGAVLVPVSNIITHEEYHNSYAYDIAMLELSYVVNYTNFIRPICLPTTDVTTENRVLFYAAGWGLLNEDLQLRPFKKQEVTLPLYDNDKCRRKLWQDLGMLLSDSQLCAGGVVGADTCGGDSGGPLMSLEENTYELVGITSFGQKPCGGNDYPGVYTKVYSYLQFIQDVVNNL